MSPRILIIDDADHMRTVLKLTLEFKGYQVETAADGNEALFRTRKEDFDLIFCDIEMPGMNGLEFVTRYRDQISKKTPIVMLTAEGSELVQKTISAGATGYLAKPFEPVRLLDEVEKQLGNNAG